MPEGLRAPAGVERDATIAALLKKVREQALELSVLSDELMMSKEHSAVCEARIAELLSTSAGGARGSASRADLFERSGSGGGSTTASPAPTPRRSPRPGHQESSAQDKEVHALKQRVQDLSAALQTATASSEEFRRKNQLMEGHLRRKTDLLLTHKTQLEAYESDVQRLQEEKEYLTRSSQPSNLRRLNKSAAAVASANAHLLQDELRRLKTALKRAEHSQLLAGQREKSLQQSLQRAEAQLAAKAAADSTLAASNARATAKDVAEETLKNDAREVAAACDTPTMKATAYIRCTTPPEEASAPAAAAAAAGVPFCSPAGRLGIRTFDTDSLDAGGSDRSELSAHSALGHSASSNSNKPAAGGDALSGEREKAKALRAEVARLQAANERLLALSEHVHAGVKTVDTVLEGGTFAWAELAQRLQRSEERGAQMNLYIKSLTGSAYRATGNALNADNDRNGSGSGGDNDNFGSDANEGDVVVLRASVSRLQTLLRQAEQERNVLVEYLQAVKEEREALSANKASMEGQHSSLLQLQHSTAEENAANQRELLDMGKFNNTLSSKCMHAEAETERVRAKLVETEAALNAKTAEAEALSRETDELSQMQIQTLMVLKGAREQSSKHEAELEKLNKAILQSGIGKGDPSSPGSASTATIGNGNTSNASPSSTPLPGSTPSAAARPAHMDVNVALLRAKLIEYERKYEATGMELATMRGHYGELRPRYHKLEARCEEQEKRIRALVEEVVELRPLRESLGRLGDEVRTGRNQWDAHVTHVPPPPPVPAAVSAPTRGYGMRDVLLGHRTVPPAPAPALSVSSPAPAPAPTPMYARPYAPASLPEAAWVDSPTLRDLSPALQASAAHLAAFAADAHAERQSLQSELGAANVRLAAETEAAAGLRAQVQALQLSQAAYGQQAVCSVQQFTSQLQSNEATNNARIRELERENCQLLRCRDTLEHLKYVVASSGGGGQTVGATGLTLLKSHLPRLIDLTPFTAPVESVNSGRRGSHSSHASSENGDSDNDTDSLEQDSGGNGARPGSPPRRNPNRSRRRYLHINSPSRDMRLLEQVRFAVTAGASRTQQPAVPVAFPSTGESADVATETSASVLPAVNDIDAILRHFSDAMLSEVVGRALLGLNAHPAPKNEVPAEEERRLRHRMQRQLEHAQQKLAQSAEETTAHVAALTAENAQLSERIKALHDQGVEGSRERKRLAAELEEVLTLSEKQQALTIAQEGKLAFYKQEKSLKVAQVNSLQQREHAMKARLVVALRDFSNTESLVDSVKEMIGRWSGLVSGADGPNNMHSSYLDSPAAHAGPLAPSLSSQDGLDRTADVVQATVSTMTSLHRCLTAVNRAHINAVERMQQHQQFGMQQQQALALAQAQLQIQQSRQPQPQYYQQPYHPSAHTHHGSDSNLSASNADEAAPGSDSRFHLAQGISLRHNTLSPPRKEDALRGAFRTGASTNTASFTAAASVDWTGKATPAGAVSFDIASAGRDGLVGSGHSASATHTAASAGSSGSASNAHQALSISHGSSASSGSNSRVRSLPRQENHMHSDNVVGLMSPATHLQNRLKDAKSKFASLRESSDV